MANQVKPFTPRKRIRLTPKQRVLGQYPRAFAYWYCDDCCRIEDQATGDWLGGGNAPKDAWADAARNL